MQQSVIYIIQSPTDSCWQIGSNLNQVQHLLLIGWKPDIISGVLPPVVAKIIAQVLCEIATVSFPTSTSMGDLKKHSPNVSFNYTPIESSRLITFLRKINPFSSLAAIVSTSDSQLAAQLFDSPLFSWELQSTIALLSRNKKAPPVLTLNILKKLLDNEKWLSEIRQITHENDILGILKPTTDGASAAMLFLSKEAKEIFLNTLKNTATKHHVEIEYISENMFKNL